MPQPYLVAPKWVETLQIIAQSSAAMALFWGVLVNGCFMATYCAANQESLAKCGFVPKAEIEVTKLHAPKLAASADSGEQGGT
ncbi:MAG: hypothetical protein AAB176_12250 [Pseudomonadota bacterium]